MLVNEPVVVEILKRLRNEGLSRHDAAHAIGSILAAQVYNVLKRERPDAGKTPANKALEPSAPVRSAMSRSTSRVIEPFTMTTPSVARKR